MRRRRTKAKIEYDRMDEKRLEAIAQLERLDEKRHNLMQIRDSWHRWLSILQERQSATPRKEGE